MLSIVVGLLDDYGGYNMGTVVHFEGKGWHREAAWAGGRWTDVHPHTCTAYVHTFQHTHTKAYTYMHTRAHVRTYTDANTHTHK